MNYAICRDMDGPRGCHTEWSKTERRKQILNINTYMWNLEKWYRWSYLQSRNRDTDIENKHGYQGGRSREMNWETAAAAKSLQLCPTLCDPIDGSPPGSPVPGNLQARTLEWAAISFSNAWKWKVKVKSLSGVWLLVTPRAAAYQAPPSMGFSRQEYWSGVPLPFPELGDWDWCIYTIDTVYKRDN